MEYHGPDNQREEKKARKNSLLFNLSKRIIKEEKNHGKKDEFHKGIRKGVPIALGYVPVGLAFGLLAKNSSFNLFETILFSFVLYAGAAQFMCVDLMKGGVSPFSIVISVFLLNLRLSVMSASLGLHTKKIKDKYLPLVGALITDETFSILYFNKDQMSTAFTLGVQLMAYFSWGLASVGGYFVGEVLPPALQSSLEVGLGCMFIGLLIPSLKGQRKNIFLCLLAAMIYVLIQKIGLFPLGWDLVVAILLSSYLGLILFVQRRKS